MNLHEQAFVESFVQRKRRERTLLCLANPKKRRKFLEWLMDHADNILMPECLRSIKPSQQHPDPIYAILRSLGAPDTCYLISEGSLDGKEMELLPALKNIVGYGDGMGTVISCLPGRLGYFEGELRERYILQK
ncbi:MAG: hypothetical protein ABR920_05550 [Terriglobales bacterium]